MARFLLNFLSTLSYLVAFCHAAVSVEQWDVFEIEMKGPSDGNPFKDVQLSASFIFNGTSSDSDNDPFIVNGFYDGNGIYKIRFLPNQIGEWEYCTMSNIESMNMTQGTFTSTQPSS